MQWELFKDGAFYEMWAVRPAGDRDFNSPRLFHFDKYEDAKAFHTLVQKANVAKPVGEYKKR